MPIVGAVDEIDERSVLTTEGINQVSTATDAQLVVASRPTSSVFPDTMAESNSSNDIHRFIFHFHRLRTSRLLSAATIKATYMYFRHDLSIEHFDTDFSHRFILCTCPRGS